MLGTFLRSMLALTLALWGSLVEAAEDGDLTKDEAEALALALNEEATAQGLDLVPVQVHGVDVMDDRTQALGLAFLGRLAVGCVQAARAAKEGKEERRHLVRVFRNWHLWPAVVAMLPRTRKALQPLLARYLDERSSTPEALQPLLARYLDERSSTPEA